MVKRSRRIRKRNRTRRRQRGGDMDLFIEHLKRPDQVIPIGKGGTGTVYLDPSQPTYVFKVSNKQDTCRQFDAEYKIYNHINKHSIDTELVKVLKMNGYKMTNNNTGCVLELSRVVNPIDPKLNYTIQVELGEDTYEYKDPMRGYILGKDQLVGKNILSDDMLPVYSEHLGVVMGRIHYIVKNDAWDVEVYAGKDGKKTILYVGDFDRSLMIDAYTPDVIERMVWSLAAVPYFPTAEQPNLFKAFTSGYMKIATSVGKEDIAKVVLSQYSR
jgi:hypothetical protein